MSTRCCFKRLLWAILIGGAFTLAGSTPAFADNPATAGFFELDGDTVPNNAPAPFGPAHDWNQQPGATGGSFAAIGTPAATGVIVDAPNPKVFTQGSKDTLDLTGWAWRSGSSPPKADIQDAYAAAYTAADGDLLVYFGLDRLSVNGTTSVGFWFFTHPVCAKSDGTFGQGNQNPATGLCSDPASPPAHHDNGDTLVTVNYTTGGITANINVFVWSGGANGTLLAPLSSTNNKNLGGLFCAPGSGTTDPANTACGITNAQPITIGWTPPEGNSNLLAGQFYEGGIDTTLLTGGQHCFASFLATTRSSATVNSETKNFVLGNFPVCSISVGKACTKAVINTAGTAIDSTFSVPIKNTGLATVSNVTLAEDASVTGETCTITMIDNTTTNTPIGTTPVSITASLTGGTTSTVTIVCEGQSNPQTNTVDATASSGGATNDLTATHTTAGAELCPGVTVTPGLNVTKVCDPSTVTLLGDGTFAFKVCDDFTVTNTSSEQMTQVTVVDTQANGQTQTVISGQTLAPAGQSGDTFTATNKCYTATTPNVGLDQVLTTGAKFRDYVSTVSGIGSLSGAFSKTDTTGAGSIANANCNLCPTQ